MNRFWRRRLRHTHSASHTKRGHAARLGLEALEGRALPAVFTVTTAADVVDANDNVLSLREAVLAANASAGVADTVQFDTALFAGPKTITLTLGELPVTDALTVTGPGSSRLTFDGNNASRLLNVDGPGAFAVTLSGLTLAHGRTAGRGGAVQVQDEALTLDGCVVTGNTAGPAGGAVSVGAGRLTVRNCDLNANSLLGPSGLGGAVAVAGPAAVTLTGSSFARNSAGPDGSGGALAFGGGSLLLDGCAVVANSAGQAGGGLSLTGTVDAGGLMVRNSTISGNTAPRGGGVALRDLTGTLQVQNSTLTANSATADGGGGIDLISGSGGVTVVSSVVAGNTGASAPDILSAGSVLVTYSAVGSPAGFTPAAGSGNNLPYGIDLRLAPLGYYGGPTLTHAPRPGSLLLDRGSNPANLATDQRGPGFPRTVGLATDIGAVEGITPPPTASGTFANVTALGTSPYTFSVRYADDQGVNVTSLGTGDVRVSGPNGFSALAEFVGVDQAANGTPRVATYRIAPPGGAWDATDNGTYTVAVEPNQVADVTGDFAAAGTVGTFRAVLPKVYVVTSAAEGGPGSLRDVLAQTNAAPTEAPDMITFDPAVFAAPRVITLTSGPLTVSDSVTVVGPGSGLLTVSGNAAGRVFAVDGTGTLQVAISGLRLTGGRSTGTTDADIGGAVFSRDENLTLQGCVLDGNSAAAGGGAVGALAGSLTLQDCVLTANSAAGPGGAVRTVSMNAVAITGCTISRNTTTMTGGGVALAGIVQFEATHLSGCVISQNTATGDGGGVSAFRLVVAGCTVADNTANGAGGGINANYLTVRDSAVSGNTANYAGGIAANNFLTLSGSSVYNNVATTREGGGIRVSPGDPFATRISNSTISGNRAAGPTGGRGGGLFVTNAYGQVFVTNSTIVGNSAAAPNGGGGIYADTFGSPFPLPITSSIVAGNAADGAPDAYGNTFQLGSSALGSPAGNNLPGGLYGNLPFGTDLKLGPLQDNGGPTKTHAPLPGSPLLNAGTNSSGLSTDQRGFPRVAGPAPDIGAVEGVSPNPTAVAVPLADVTQAGPDYTFRVTFYDDAGISVATLGAGDMRVTGPNGYSAPAAFVGVDQPSDGSPRVATYRVPAPGGAWDPTDYGVYTVTVEPNQVSDGAGNFVPPLTLGSFQALLPSTIPVTNTNDSGPGSLRAAVAQANSVVGAADVIVFDPAYFAVPRTIVLTSGQLSITDPVTVSGPGAGRLTVSGNSASRIFSIDGPGSMAVTISGLTLTAGKPVVSQTDSAGGGAILSADENLTVADCVLADNTAVTYGGAINAAGGTLTVRNCTVSGNTLTFTSESGGAGIYLGGPATVIVSNSTLRDNATVRGQFGDGRIGYFGNGGGLYFSGGSLVLENSTVVGNTANSGGGVYLGGSLSSGPGSVIRNSTIAGNTALGTGFDIEGIGGGVFAGNFLTITNSTITGNTAQTRGGGVGLLSSPGVLTVRSSVVAGNVNAAAPDIYETGSVTATNCLIGSAAGFTLASGSGNNRPYGTDPRLGPLQDNGGPTPTFALLPGSPLLDAGANPATLATDQRGFPRVTGSAPDIGAVEQYSPTPTGVLAAPLADVTTPGGAAYTFTVSYAGDTAIAAATLGAGDVRVTGPNGFSVLPTLVAIDPAGNGTTRAATYTFAPPGGSWDPSDGGGYAVTVEPNEVADTAGRVVPPGVLGGIRVYFPGVVNRFTVHSTADSGPGSLREALELANRAAGSADTVAFDPGVFGVPRTVTLTSGELAVTDSVTVLGPGAGLLTVSGNGGTRLLRLDGPGTLDVTLSGLTLTGGHAQRPGGPTTLGLGGAVHAGDEHLTVQACRLVGNTADDEGGAIYGDPGGSVTVLDSTLADNRAAEFGGRGGAVSATGVAVRRSSVLRNTAGPGSTAAGGGIYFSGAFLLDSSTVAGNSTGGLGGGLCARINSLAQPASATLLNSTVSGNSAGRSGGGIEFGDLNGPLLVRNSTVTANTAGESAGGIDRLTDYYKVATPLTVESSIVSGNADPFSYDIVLALGTPPVVITRGAIGRSAGVTLAPGSGNNLPDGVDLRLGPLADHGGPTQTHELLPGSPAIDAGSNPAGLIFDQRGFNYARVGGAAADIGAYEVQRPARVASAVVNGGAAQRSRVTEFTVTFSHLVTLPADPATSFRLTRTGPGGPTGDVTLAVDLSGSTATRTVARLTFSSPLTQAGSLVDGSYTLTVLGDRVIGPGGLALDGDGDGQPGGDYTLSLYRLFGDTNGDRTVDAVDLFAFAGAYGKRRGEAGYLDSLDGNGDGVVDALDLFAFAGTFGKTLP